MTTSGTQFGILIYSFGLINSLEENKSLSFSQKGPNKQRRCEYKTLLKDSYPLRVDLEKEKMPISISKLCATMPTWCASSQLLTWVPQSVGPSMLAT
jgi:hypothetical protein